MELVSRQVGSVTVLAPTGELTAATAPGFLRRGRLLVAPASPPLVAMDLSGVRRLDSSGYAALVSLLRHVQRRGGEVCLVGLTADARLLLEIMQLHLLFDVCEDVPSAVEALTAAHAAAAPAPPGGRRLLGRVRWSSLPVARRAAS
jgi:anti-anti-sigma factor